MNAVLAREISVKRAIADAHARGWEVLERVLADANLNHSDAMSVALVIGTGCKDKEQPEIKKE